MFLGVFKTCILLAYWSALVASAETILLIEMPKCPSQKNQIKNSKFCE
jgi:hypothetical protein